MRTLAIVKQDSIELEKNIENVLEEDTLNLEASTLTKDDKDFKVYVSSGKNIEDCVRHLAQFFQAYKIHSSTYVYCAFFV